MGTSDDLHPLEAARIARRLWSEAFNLFRDDASGIWYAGRFLDHGRYTRGPNAGREMSPWHRQQEIFGCGATLREALRFCLGRQTTYSIPGMAPGLNDQRGCQPVFDRLGRVLGFNLPSGVFSKTFPNDKIVTA